MEINKIYCMDCLEGMKQLEDNSVDITITSPPYNLRAGHGGKTVRYSHGKAKEIVMYDEYKDNKSQEEYKDWIKEVIIELIRVTKYYVFFNFMLITDNKDAYLQLMAELRENIKEVIVWTKKQVQPSMSPTCLSSGFEFILVFSDKEKAKKRSFNRAFFNNRRKGMWQKNFINGDSADRKGKKVNNFAVFPDYFVRWFVKNFSKEGDIILDPFIGSGTTAWVAKSMNRKYIGFEISKNYIQHIDKKLKQESLKEFA